MLCVSRSSQPITERRVHGVNYELQYFIISSSHTYVVVATVWDIKYCYIRIVLAIFPYRLFRTLCRVSPTTHVLRQVYQLFFEWRQITTAKAAGDLNPRPIPGIPALSSIYISFRDVNYAACLTLCIPTLKATGGRTAIFLVGAARMEAFRVHIKPLENRL